MALLDIEATRKAVVERSAGDLLLDEREPAEAGQVPAVDLDVALEDGLTLEPLLEGEGLVVVGNGPVGAQPRRVRRRREGRGELNRVLFTPASTRALGPD
jgi:hypothetical protein